jgi:hypothetical protein
VRKMNRVLLVHEKDTMPLSTTYQPEETRARFRGRSKKDLLLRHPNFVAKPTNPSFEPPPLACETGASQVGMNWTRTGKKGTTNGVSQQMNPELGLQVYLTF